MDIKNPTLLVVLVGLASCSNTYMPLTKRVFLCGPDTETIFSDEGLPIGLIVGDLSVETVLGVDGRTVEEVMVSYLGTSTTAQVINEPDSSKTFRYLFQGTNGTPFEIIDNRDQRNVTLVSHEREVSCGLALAPIQ